MLSWIKNIGLSWKVQLAPVFLILVLVGTGAYALLALRSNQAAVDALVSGPVRQSEIVGDLTTAAWTAHAKLYRLAATAANEKDEKKWRRLPSRLPPLPQRFQMRSRRSKTLVTNSSRSRLKD